MQQLGGWSPYSCHMDEEAKAVFKKAFEDFVGVKYSPVAVATQVVAGMNYSFFCNAQGVYPHAVSQPAIVDIEAPLNGDPRVANIMMCQH
jgi:hypothetical protein